jgi:hypothetical protein
MRSFSFPSSKIWNSFTMSFTCIFNVTFCTTSVFQLPHKYYSELFCWPLAWQTNSSSEIFHDCHVTLLNSDCSKSYKYRMAARILALTHNLALHSYHQSSLHWTSLMHVIGIGILPNDCDTLVFIGHGHSSMWTQMQEDWAAAMAFSLLSIKKWMLEATILTKQSQHEWHILWRWQETCGCGV